MTPDYLNEVVKGTENIVADTNLAIIKVLATKILKQYSKYGEITFIPSTQKQFRAMMGTGMVASTIEEELTKELPNLQKEIHSAFIDSANEMSIEQAHIAKSIIDVEGIDYDLKKIPFQTVVTDKASELNMTPSQVRLLEDSYKQTNKLMKNLVNTSGVCTEVNFVELCDETYMKVRHGMSMDQAIVEVIDGLAKKGIVVQYGNRMDSIETALTRAVRTAINQTNARIVLQNCAEMGVGWVKVSEHLGARVTGTSDYKDHSWWQGKVYSLDWNKGALASYKPSDKLPDKVEYISKIKDAAERKQAEKYEDFVEACGYGDILGICGVNCRHTFHSWYPGINIDRGPEIDADENKKRYEQEQKARAMERAIKKDRRELVAKQAEIDNLPEGVEKDQAQARFDELSYRVTEKTTAYNEFVRVNKLGNGTGRLEIGGFKDVANDISHEYAIQGEYSEEDIKSNLLILASKNASPKAKAIAKAINPTEQMIKIGELVKDYTTNPSHWSGILRFRINLDGFGKYVRKTGNIYLKPNAPTKTRIHEYIHSCTDWSDFNRHTKMVNGKLNEGAIEYLSEEICKENGIPFNPTYPQYVNPLREIAAILKIKDIQLAKAIANASFGTRYSTLEALCNLSTLTDQERVIIDENLKKLYGPHKR